MKHLDNDGNTPHYEGQGKQGSRPKFMFHERDDNLAFCPILYVLALAFADNAFASEWINCLEDLGHLILVSENSHRLPPHKVKLVQLTKIISVNLIYILHLYSSYRKEKMRRDWTRDDGGA
ncbi:MAG: hypothetical protein M1813_001355 [Trichoglossum hirsutum]|nr:MAG: hypothetical protein M1813_001355 [Trichoglossum hirsutum]